MKELSIEEKAKRYDEALKVLHKYDGANIMFTQDLKEEMFPELKESEDERIRKRLINAFEEFLRQNDYDKETNFKGINAKDAIAWLEKQGEHAKFRDSIQVGDKVTRNQDGVLVNLSQLNRVAKKDEKQGEQKCNEEYNITGIKSKNAEGKLGEMIMNLKSVNEVLEQKPAWSEEVQEEQVNEEFINALGTMLNDGLPDRYLVSEERIKKSAELLFSIARKQLKNEMQGWSEEDEEMFISLKTLLNDASCYSYTEGADKILSWLKSIKDRYTWKPSEEQMMQLGWVAEQNAHNILGKELMSLYQDLKKLR